ncbi:hypothetical protein [Streptomyces sp. AS13]|nr:hypothetical protein [Streptomyces sp. AS13]
MALSALSGGVTVGLSAVDQWHASVQADVGRCKPTFSGIFWA